MKGYILILITISLFFSFTANSQSQRLLYRGEKRSLTDWSKVNPMNWTDLKQWRNQLTLRDKTPYWENILTEKKLIETVGYILDCVGECRIYRGSGSFKAQYRSSIKEGDELHVGDNSYAWAFLVDGTMVRLSSDTSMTFREINIGKDEIFLQARLNTGNVLWLSRQAQEFNVSNDRETDTVFYPIGLYEASTTKENVKLDEDNLFALLEEPQETSNQYKRLNKYIEDNNKWINNKKTYSLLIMPNGSVAGYNMSVEAIALFGGDSFVKSRSFNQSKLIPGKIEELHFYFRGFRNTQVSTIDTGQWYKIDKRGRKLKRYYLDQLFKIGEFLTSQIPTIYIARELWLRKYSKIFFGNVDKVKLARKHGYRLWGSLQKSKKEEQNLDLAKRLEFLIEFTRRVETTNILTTQRFLKKMDEIEEFVPGRTYGRSFFNSALVDYYSNRRTFNTSDSDREVLNSTQQLYWKKLHDIK